MHYKTIGVPRLVLNFAVLSGGEFVSKVFAFVAFAYLARVLGPADFGQLEFVLAVLFFFTLISDCGLSPYGAREIAKNRDSVERLTTHIMIVRCLLVAAALALMGIFVSLIDKPWPVRRLVLLYGLTLIGLPGLLPWVFQGHDRMRQVAMASILRWSVFSGGVILCIRGPEQIWVVPLIEVIAIGAAVLFYLRAFANSFGSLRQPVDGPFALSLLRQALPIGASELVWALKVYFATIFLGLLLLGSEVGWFAAAHRIVISLHTFVWLYFFSLLPSIARSTQALPDALHRLMGTSIQITAWSAIFIGITGTAFAGQIVALLYGPQYEKAVPVFQVLIWLIPLALMSGHYRYVLIAYNRQGLEFLTAACGAGLNILLNLYLIPSYGLVGAASALVSSEALIWALAYYCVRRKIAPIPIWTHLWRPLVGGMILASVLYLLSTKIWMAASSAVAVYCLVVSIMQPELLTQLRTMLARNR